MTDRFDPERFERDSLENADGTSYESMAPQPRDPTPSPPEAPSVEGGGANVDPGLKVLFWRLVLLYKFSVLGLTLGTLLVIFDVSADRGGWLLVGSLILFGYTVYQTRRAKQRLDSDEFDSDDQPDDVRTTDSNREAGEDSTGSTNTGESV